MDGRIASPAQKTSDLFRGSPAWAAIREQFFASGKAAPVQSSLTGLADQRAIAAFQATLAAAFPQGVAICAVGGFGRRELFPFSDIDITVLVADENLAAHCKDPLSEFVRELWDSGMRLSHSVRTPTECVEVHEQNIELNISLLDRRFLAGDREVFAKLDSRMPGFLAKQGHKLGRHLCQLTRVRHNKYHDTLYHLEPDVKETPGGLRDLHFINWLSRLAPEHRFETHKLAPATAFVSSLRCLLHYHADRDRNVLDFEAQEYVVEQPFIQSKSVENWMREYFRNARVIFSEARRALDASEKSENSLLENFRDWRTRLSNSDFSVIRDRVFFRSPARLETGPSFVFTLLEFIGRHGLPAAADTERRLETARDAFAAWCAKQHALWPRIKAVFALPYAAMALRTLQDTGCLGAIFPEWDNIGSLVVMDFYHRYTVDEHTLVTIEQVCGLRHNSDPKLQRLSDLLAELDNPALLLFSLLFHDVGKGAHSGDHSRVSVELAQQAMARIGMPEEEREAVAFLIVQHLILSDVMTTRDLSDPATARMLADRVGTIERLKQLTLLTYADISAVNPGAMTPWRLEQLWRTYRVTQQELTRELETQRIAEIPKELPVRADFIKGFPVRYLRTHSPSEIQAHVELYEQSRPTGVAVELGRSDGGYQLSIVARDMPFLFASFAGAISSFGMDILKAEAFANAKGLVLDTFVFADPRRNLELNPPETERLKDLIRKVAAGKADVPQLLRNRVQPDPRRKSAPPTVQFDSDACETATLVEIVAQDRPGLLYHLASAFSSSGCNIDVVLIDTKGQRAIDVFYVAQQGKKLSPDQQASLQERLLAAC